MISIDSEDKDLVPPIKKLLIKSPSSESVPSVTPGSTDLSPQTQQSTVKHKVIKVKRSSSNVSSSPPMSNSRINSGQVNMNPKPNSVGRKAITWP